MSDPYGGFAENFYRRAAEIFHGNKSPKSLIKTLYIFASILRAKYDILL